MASVPERDTLAHPILMSAIGTTNDLRIEFL